MTMPLDLPDLETEIRDRVDRLAARSSYLFVHPVPTAKRNQVTAWHLKALRGNAGEDAIRQIVFELVDPGELDTAGFWGSALGRAVAWHIGYHREVVPVPTAGAILEVTRQAVHDARKRGALRAGPGGAGIDRASLLAYLRAQFGAGA